MLLPLKPSHTSLLLNFRNIGGKDNPSSLTQGRIAIAVCGEPMTFRGKMSVPCSLFKLQQ